MKESTGNAENTARLSEALQAHVWPDIAMKSDGSDKAANAPLRTAHAQTMPLSDGGKIFDEDEQESDPGGESFEELFAKFADMKGKAYNAGILYRSVILFLLISACTAFAR